MRRYGELSKDREPLLPHQFCSDCIIATRGYDFREGQVLSRPNSYYPSPPNSAVVLGARVQARPRPTDLPSKLLARAPQ
jgi:hypothetical protein